MHYPNIIIGAGIAGLYLAYRLKQRNESFIILEKSNRIGGRLEWRWWHQTKINLGGAVIRETDTEILALCAELDIKLTLSDNNYDQHPAIFVSLEERIEMTNQIKSTYHKIHASLSDPISFETFMYVNFPSEFVLKFKSAIMYEDFWKWDLDRVINLYPLEEILFYPTKTYTIDHGWEVLLDALKVDGLHLDEAVEQIDWPNKTIHTSKSAYITDRLFICTDLQIKSIKLNLPPDVMQTLNLIESIPFMRLYTYYPFGHQLE